MSDLYDRHESKIGFPEFCKICNNICAINKMYSEAYRSNLPPSFLFFYSNLILGSPPPPRIPPYSTRE